jgi:hypothetical protein
MTEGGRFGHPVRLPSPRTDVSHPLVKLEGHLSQNARRSLFRSGTVLGSSQFRVPGLASPAPRHPRS